MTNSVWVVSRRATLEDYEKLLDAKRRFKDRHGDGDFIDTVLDGYNISEDELVTYEWKYLRKLWLRCVRRALKCRCDGIEWNTVGHWQRG